MTEDDRRKRPWQKLRVIVEVTVPPHSKVRERDLLHAVAENLPKDLTRLPRPINSEGFVPSFRVKAFSRFWPAFLRIERGLSINTKPKKDPYQGL